MSNNWPTEAVMMTLSGIAYSSNISGQLQITSYATGGDWSLVWGPYDDSYGNLAYVAKSVTGDYAVVIRGSETTVSWDTLYNWFYNLYVTWQSPWIFMPTQPQAMLSFGAITQASNLVSASWNGQTLGNFITQSIPAHVNLYVTGHSLGGNLATVIASWISYQRGPIATDQDLQTLVYTYAAPSAGNHAFADGFNARFPNSFRYWNALDAIPRAWDNLLQLNWIYDGIGIPTPGWAQDTVYTLEALLFASEIDYDSFYLQPNGSGSELFGSASPLNPDFISEVAYQHMVNVYLGLLNAPLIKPIAGASFAAKAALASTLKGDFLPRPIFNEPRSPGRTGARPIVGLPRPLPPTADRGRPGLSSPPVSRSGF